MLGFVYDFYDEFLHDSVMVGKLYGMFAVLCSLH